MSRHHSCCGNTAEYSENLYAAAENGSVSGRGVCHPDPYYRGPCAPGRDYDSPNYPMPCSDHVCPGCRPLACGGCRCDCDRRTDRSDFDEDFALLRASLPTYTDSMNRLPLSLVRSSGRCFAFDSNSLTFNRAGLYRAAFVTRGSADADGMFLRLNGRDISGCENHSAVFSAHSGDSLCLASDHACDYCGEVELLIYLMD